MDENKENPILSFYYDENSPSGVGFEAIDELASSESTICTAMNLATQISDTLPEEAKRVMFKEEVPLFRIYTDNKGFWGEWCNIEGADIEDEMNNLLNLIAQDLEEISQK